MQYVYKTQNMYTYKLYIYTYICIYSFVCPRWVTWYIYRVLGLPHSSQSLQRKNRSTDFHATNPHRGDSFPGFHARTGAHQAAAAKNKIHNESVFDWKTAQNFQNHQNLQYETVSTAWKLDSTQMSMWRARKRRARKLHAISASEANDAHLHRDLFADVPGDFQCWFLIHHVRWVLIHHKVKPLWKSLEKHSFSNKTPLIECINFIYNQGSCESSGDFERCSSLTSNSAEIYMFQDSSQDAV